MTWSSPHGMGRDDVAMRRLKAATIARLLGRTSAAIRGKAANCGIDIVSDRASSPIWMRLDAR